METGPASQEILQNLLANRCCDLRSLQPATFLPWLHPLLQQWQQSPIFQTRVEIRDIRHSSSLLRQLERNLRHAEHQDQASQEFSEISQLEKELANTTKALTGLEQAWRSTTDTQRQKALREKREGFRLRHHQLESHLNHLVDTSPTRQLVLQLKEQLDPLKRQLGLVDKERQLAALLRSQGQGSGRAGVEFETRAVQAAQRFILPEVLLPDVSLTQPQILTSVTLGAARMELDQVVVQVPAQKGEAVLVLAVVETKRNLNDLAHGFRQRQENLAWLTGTTPGYDPALYRTRSFPTGHFDREVHWRQDEQDYLFRPDSFRLFQPEPTGYFLERLYFITRPGPLWGVSSAGLSRIQYRIATDTHWPPDSEEDLKTYLAWCQSLTDSLETPDLLRLYSTHWAKQIILLS